MFYTRRKASFDRGNVLRRIEHQQATIYPERGPCFGHVWKRMHLACASIDDGATETLGAATPKLKPKHTSEIDCVALLPL